MCQKKKAMSTWKVWGGQTDLLPKVPGHPAHSWECVCSRESRLFVPGQEEDLDAWWGAQVPGLIQYK